MLTRELLKFQRKNGIKIQFIDPLDSDRTAVAEALLTIYHSAAAARLTHGELDELTDAQIKGAKDSVFAAGLNKLLLDRCSFDPVCEIDYPARRRALFTQAAALLAEAGGDHAAYLERITENPEHAEFMAVDIYGDLPDHERLNQWRPLSCRELLNRYNLALVQGVLIYAESLDLTVGDTDPAELRRLFKYLKFFRLLAEVTKAPPRDLDTAQAGLKISISGPFSLFGPTRKYALQLATFFPAAVKLQTWKLRAKIKIGNSSGELQLDQNAPLISHYNNFSSYVPEEIRLFHRHFKETVKTWKIVGDSPFLNGGGSELIFPDLSFEHTGTGKLLHLELFHRWHRTQLERRLAYLDKHRPVPLLLGIDRALADDAAFEELQEKYPALTGRIYRFRNFPGVDRTCRMLDSFSAVSK